MAQPALTALINLNRLRLERGILAFDSRMGASITRRRRWRTELVKMTLFIKMIACREHTSPRALRRGPCRFEVANRIICFNRKQKTISSRAFLSAEYNQSTIRQCQSYRACGVPRDTEYSEGGANEAAAVGGNTRYDGKAKL